MCALGPHPGPGTRSVDTVHMKPCLLGLALLLSSGCTGFFLGEASPRVQAERAKLTNDVIQAVISAHSLEASLFAKQPPAGSRDEVLGHFRQGFSEEIAQRLTEAMWDADQWVLKPGQANLFPIRGPIEFLELRKKRATVFYHASKEELERWQSMRWQINELIKTNDQWIIRAGHETDRRPKPADTAE